MPEPNVQLFTVECRGSGGVTTFVVPAQSSDGAIAQAMNSAQGARAQYPDIGDPFQEAGLEVRVGTYESAASSKVIFGDWTRLSN